MRTKWKLGFAVGVMLLGTNLAYAATLPTWTYDADSNKFPNEAGQPMFGSVLASQTVSNNTLIDLGAGDLVMQSAPVAGAAFYQLNANTDPGTEWSVSSAYLTSLNIIRYRGGFCSRFSETNAVRFVTYLPIDIAQRQRRHRHAKPLIITKGWCHERELERDDRRKQAISGQVRIAGSDQGVGYRLDPFYRSI